RPPGARSARPPNPAQPRYAPRASSLGLRIGLSNPLLRAEGGASRLAPARPPVPSRPISPLSAVSWLRPLLTRLRRRDIVDGPERSRIASGNETRELTSVTAPFGFWYYQFGF